MSNAVESLLARKRELLDIWNIREKLCLASAVACSGDQNWMSVSRSLKMVCSDNQPHDWFAQKACAIQYGKLLENTETPKRKKRSERDSSPVVTPIESLVKRLSFERIAELKQAIIDDQQEYAKLKEELSCLHTADEAKVREMWQQIEMEKKQVENDQVARQKWLKERDVKKLELERSLRPALIFQGVRPQLQLKIKSEDMDIEETKPTAQSGTPSPLLTSLLKSPSHSQAIMHPSRQAPTITNLLTAGSSTASPLTTIPPAITPANPPMFIVATQLQNASDSNHIPVTQSAPTLSMLLDKKPSNNSGFGQTADSFLFSQSTQQQLIDEGNSKEDDDVQLMAVLDDLMIDNDELDNILADNNSMLNPDLLEEGAILEASLKEEENDIERMKEELGEADVKQDAEEMQVDEISEQMEQMHSGTIVVGDDLVELNALAETDPSPDILESNDLQETILMDQDLEMPESNQPAETSQVPVNQIETQEVVKIEIIDSEEDLPLKNLEVKPEPEPVAAIDPYEFDDTLEEQVIVKLHAEEKPSFVVEEKSKDSEEDVYEDANDTIMELPVEPKEDLKIKDEAIAENVDTDDDDTLADLQQEVKKEALEIIKSRERRKRSDSKKIEDVVKIEDASMRSTLTRSNRNRSSSSFMDEDSDHTPLRSSRRRSTPVTDYSVPNSPAGAEDRDYKLWKKTIMIAYNLLSKHKQASQFFHPITEEQHPGYHNIIKRPMDLQTVKKNLENGTIRSTVEFKRDVCLMISNALMYNKKGTAAFAAAQEMWFDGLGIIDQIMDQYKPPPGQPSSCSSSSSSKEQASEKSAVKRKSLRTQMN